MPSTTSDQYAIILLAAGKSSRFGEPKQLLPYKGSTLIRSATTVALEISNLVIVVTGAEDEKIKAALHDLPVIIAYNKEFKTGIASSIREGIIVAKKEFSVLKGIILLVSDQPYISSSVLNQLIEKVKETNKGIIACAYSDTLGTPVLFQHKFLNKLLHLKGDSGAKKLIQQYMDETAIVHFPEGAIDIDTVKDYRALIN
jgi:molybdenum cofactor cytidylyltransferase